jgi:hypothetical protein
MIRRVHSFTLVLKNQGRFIFPGVKNRPGKNDDNAAFTERSLFRMVFSVLEK